MKEKIDWDQLAKTKGIRIRHFKYRGRLIGTMVYRIPLHEEALTSYGLTMVSRKDSPNREKGRMIAYGRLLTAEKYGENKPLKNKRVERIAKRKLSQYETNVSLKKIREIIYSFPREQAISGDFNLD